MRGKFITFEGGEGSGKSTQIKLLKEYFVSTGKKCTLTREPGGTAGGEAIRKLLLEGSGDKWNAISETLLFQAARIEHVENIIKPALANGETVLCDRFLDSTIVYQGISKKLGVGYVNQLHQLTLGNFLPDFTILLDIDPKLGLLRTKSRVGNETRFENMNIEFHEAVRSGFLSLAKKEPSRFAVIDAARDVDAVHKSIINTLLSLAVF